MDYELVRPLLTILIGGTLVILGGLLFTNSVEYLASKYRISSTFIGAIISPILTSLPELVVIIVALIHGGSAGSEISIGTIIGEPFMASTIVYSMLVIAGFIGYIKKRRDKPLLEPSRDLYVPFLTFSILFPLVLVPSFIRALFVRIALALVMLLAYFLYVFAVIRASGEIIEENVEAVYFGKFMKSETYAAFVQVVFSILLIYLGSERLVGGIVELSRIIGISMQALSIIVVPSVAALPESVVGLVWAYKGRDTLALASVVGEKVLYSTFYPGVGMLVTCWCLDLASVFCVVYATAISLLMLYYVLRRRIGAEVAALGVAGYLLYCLTVFHVLKLGAV